MKGEKSILKNSIFNISYRMVSVLFPLISAGYIARILDPQDVGMISLAKTNVSYFVILATLGIPAFGIREVAKIRENKKETNKLFSELLLLNGTLTTISIILYTLFIHILPSFNKEIDIYIILGVTLFFNYINIDWLFYGFEEYSYISIRGIIIKTVSLIALFLLVRDEQDVYIYAIIHVCSTVGSYFVNILLSHKYVSFSLKSIDPLRHIKPLLYLMLCTISTEIYAKVDITMLGYIKDSETVAYYTYAHSTSNMVVTFIVAATSVFLPKLSYYYNRDKQRFVQLVNSGFSFLLAFVIPSFIGIVCLADSLVAVWLGDGYSKVVEILRVFSIMIPLKCVGDLICYQVMLSAGKESVLMKIYAITMAINVVGNVVLIPRCGALGASIASVLSELLVFVFVFQFTRKQISLRLDIKTFIPIVVGSLVMTMNLLLINSIIINPALNLVVGVLVGAFSYVAINIHLKSSVFLSIIHSIKTKLLNR